jgi:hypothetical protein
MVERGTRKTISYYGWGESVNGKTEIEQEGVKWIFEWPGVPNRCVDAI